MHTMKTVMAAIEASIKNGRKSMPVLTSNQCHSLAWFLNKQDQGGAVGEMISKDGDIYWVGKAPPMGFKLYTHPAVTKPQGEEETGTCQHKHWIAHFEKGEITAEVCQACGDVKQRLVPEEPTPSRHPIQPLYLDNAEVLRFKGNNIVRTLLDIATAHGEYDLNDIVRDPATTREDLVQLYQLIGYSLAGYGELQAVSDLDYNAAEAMYTNDLADADKARIQALEGTLQMLRDDLYGPMAVLFGKHPDDLKDGRP